MKKIVEEIIWYVGNCPKCGDKIKQRCDFDEKTKCEICETEERLSFLIGSKITGFRISDDDIEIDMIKIETNDGKKYGIYGKELSYDNLSTFDILEH